MTNKHADRPSQPRRRDHRSRPLAGLAVISALCGGACVGDSDAVDERPFDCTRPKMIGHRGSPNYRPENTIPAFEYAMVNGGAGIEIDLHLSADRQLVAMHDFTVDRTTNAQGRVDSFTLEALNAMDAGSWFSSDYSATRVPSFAQIIEAIDPYEGLYMLDIRESDVLDAALDEVAARGLGSRTLVAVWNTEFVDRACAHEAGVTAIYFVSQESQIPDAPYDCLQIIRFRGAGDKNEAISKKIIDRGFESMMGGWSVRWGLNRWGIADSMHTQLPWVDETRPEQCVGVAEFTTYGQAVGSDGSSTGM